MAKIKILPPNVANQIAAGEVIERPASVVKELIENSLDAGADRIEIAVEGGGRDLIQIKDNGVGMDREDIELAVEPHATSKIATEKDLSSIQTLGFRGEALASIASVSNFTLISRPKHAQQGWELNISFGHKKSIKPKGCPSGTLVKVEDLFGQIPARRKFLKSAQTELGHISQTVRIYAAANPTIHFELTSKKRTLFRSKQGLSGSLALWPLVGEKIASRLLKFEGSGPWFSIKGYISGPEDGRSTSKGFYFFVNNRIVREKMLWKALSEACKGSFVKGTYPLGAVFIQVEPEYVDVNCHPSKQEVRFRDGSAIFQALYNGIKRALESRHDPLSVGEKSIHHLKFNNKNKISQLSESPPIEINNDLKQDQPLREDYPIQPSIPLEVNDSIQTTENFSTKSDRFEPFESSSPFRLIGHLENTYILFQGPEGLIMVDQHAAHEAILFKNIMDSLESNKTIVSQTLAFPIIISKSHDEVSQLDKSKHILKKLGLKLESFGATEIAVHEVPEIVARQPDKTKIISELIDKALEINSSDPKSLLWDLVAKIACRCAIKADDELHSAEMKQLIDDLIEQGITNCPHGRPVVIAISLEEIQKRFKRI